MIVFLDFEASSLSKKSYPIEVAWVFEDGTSYSTLVGPATDWTDWSTEAEAIHKISRAQLATEGIDVKQVAKRMLEALAGHDICASAPSWDGKWLSTLLRAAGFPRHALRLRRSDDVFFEEARRCIDGSVTDEKIIDLVNEIIKRTEPPRPAHRALPDARLELWRLEHIRKASRVQAQGPLIGDQDLSH